MSGLWVLPEELGDYAYTEFALEAAQTASYLLWTMSGRKFSGLTTVTERYVCAKRAYRMGASSKNYYATLINGEAFNIPISDFDQYAELVADGLSPESRIKMRGRPIVKVHTIRTRDGRIIDPAGYYVVDRSTIQASAGVPWTPCNIEVTYTYGTEVPVAGKMAARTLAIEFAKLWSDDETCQLPQRVTSIARQGVTYTLLDSQDFIAEVRTGVYAIDLFLKAVNPVGAKAKSRVFSPDVPRGRTYNRRPPVLAANSALDLTVVQKTPATWNSVTADVDTTIFIDEPGVWTPKVTLRNHSGNAITDLDQGDIVLNPTTGEIDFTVSYNKALRALAMIDPGTWTLYASSIDPVTGNESLGEIVTGNLTIQLFS
jgi:hypothetical protein